MEPLNRKELADLLGVTVRTISNHQMQMGFKNGLYDPVTAVRYWVKYVQDQKDKEYNKTDEIRQYQLEQEKEKAFALRRNREILEGSYISVESIKEIYGKLVHNTKVRFLGLLNILPRKLAGRKRTQLEIKKILKPEIYRTLEELSRGINQNGRDKKERFIQRRNIKTAGKRKSKSS